MNRLSADRKRTLLIMMSWNRVQKPHSHYEQWRHPGSRKLITLSGAFGRCRMQVGALRSVVESQVEVGLFGIARDIYGASFTEHELDSRRDNVARYLLDLAEVGMVYKELAEVGMVYKQPRTIRVGEERVTLPGIWQPTDHGARALRLWDEADGPGVPDRSLTDR